MYQTMPRKLKQNVDTRWHSMHDMMRSYLGQHRQAVAAIDMSGNHKVSIIDKEFDTMRKATRSWSLSSSTSKQ